MLRRAQRDAAQTRKSNEGLELEPGRWHLRGGGEHQRDNHVASRRYGVFSVGQARAAGFDRFARHRRGTSGVWVRLDDSVYALSSAPRTWEQTACAAVLSRPSAVLTHTSAARLLGLRDFAEFKPVILISRGSNTRSPLARVFESDQYEASAKTVVDSLPVTTMPETILVLAREFRGHRLEETFDEALLSGKLDLDAMSRTLDREAGRRTPGTPQLRRLTTSRRPTAPSRSSTYLERLLERVAGPADPILGPRARVRRPSVPGRCLWSLSSSCDRGRREELAHETGRLRERSTSGQRARRPWHSGPPLHVHDARQPAGSMSGADSGHLPGSRGVTWRPPLRGAARWRDREMKVTTAEHTAGR